MSLKAILPEAVYLPQNFLSASFDDSKDNKLAEKKNISTKRALEAIQHFPSSFMTKMMKHNVRIVLTCLQSQVTNAEYGSSSAGV